MTAQYANALKPNHAFEPGGGGVKKTTPRYDDPRFGASSGLAPQASPGAPAALTAAAVTGLVPAGGTGAAAGGWATAGDRDTAIATITELKTKLNAVVADNVTLRSELAALITKLTSSHLLT